MIRIAALILSLSTLLSGQIVNSVIRIQAARSAAKPVAADPAKSAVHCFEPPPAPPAPQVPTVPTDSQVRALCQALMYLVGPDQLQISFAVYTLSKQDKLIDKSAVESFLSSVAESRIDKQNGATSSGNGTTTVVERSGISDVLGAALEAGAVTQSVSGSTLTLQGNALSLVRFFKPGDSVFQYCPETSDGGTDQPDKNQKIGSQSCYGHVQDFLNRISGTASLGLSNQSTQTVTGTVAASGPSGASGSSGQTSAAALIQDSASHLTGFSIRFQAINTLDLRSKAYLDAWKTAVNDPNLANLAETAAGKFETFFKSMYNPAQRGSQDEKWLLDSEEALRVLVLANAPDDALNKAIAQRWDALIARWQQDNSYAQNAATLKDFLQAANAYMAARDLAVNNVRQKLANGLTFEYDYSRADNQPRISTARVIYTLHPGTISKDMSSSGGSKAKPSPSGSPQTAPGQADDDEFAIVSGRGQAPPSGKKPNAGVKTVDDSAITFNFAADMYDSPPSGTGVLKDIQAALQLDHHFGNVIATLSGYYQYQNQPSALMITSASLAPGTNIMLNGNAATLLAPRGHIWVAEAMVTFPLKSGTTLPVGVTWSNRTDLINGNEFRGHVGFSFDWSSLLLGKQANSSQP